MKVIIQEYLDKLSLDNILVTLLTADNTLIRANVENIDKPTVDQVQHIQTFIGTYSTSIRATIVMIAPAVITGYHIHTVDNEMLAAGMLIPLPLSGGDQFTISWNVNYEHNVGWRVL